MDPIYYQVNQTKLTEVTQKKSDNLRLQSNKEAKRKSQANEIDKSALSADTTCMSDDMLGNMDPDDYGGRGAEEFAQMWKDQLDEEPQDEEPEEEADSDQDQAEEESSVEDGELDDSEADGDVELQPDPVQLALEPETNEAPPESPPKTEGAPSADKVASTRPSSRGSLLDFSSGYLIAEEAQWEPEETGSEPAKVEPEVEPALPEDVSILLERLVTGDSSQPAFRKLNQMLARFGRKVLQLCLEVEAKVWLLPPGETLLAHPQVAVYRVADLEGAVYLSQLRLCLIEDGCLSQAPYGFHPVFYYFAHLYDHALGGENFASLKSAAVRASYQACLDGAHRFGDLMASFSPAHYFAQAVESYLAENDCLEPLWTRQDLYDFDRSIYEYIEYLLK